MEKGLQNEYTIPINVLLNHAINEYLDNDKFQHEIKKISIIKKIWNEREINKLSEKLINDLEPYRTKIQEGSNNTADLSSPEIEEVKFIVTEFLLKADKRKLLFDRPFIKFFIEQGYLDAAEKFITTAKKEAPQLKDEEIFQALRNIWIMNSLQIYWGLPVEMTPSVYAYSMLYPYTDNFLDNPEYSREEKIKFNKRLYGVLNGEKLTPESFIEEKIFSLVNQIESQYCRDTYPEVYESLRLIQEAQTESMRQDGDKVLTYDSILPISFFKGGTSVLADAFLVKGKLTINEMHFSFTYGTFLQLLDDLQDAKVDKKDNHQTLFSTKRNNELIDNEVTRIILYIFKVNTANESDTKLMTLMKEVISSCTLIMIMDAVGRNPEIVSGELYRELESYSKIRLMYYKKFEDKIRDLLK
jgi:hypothetical protein